MNGQQKPTVFKSVVHGFEIRLRKRSLFAWLAGRSWRRLSKKGCQGTARGSTTWRRSARSWVTDSRASSRKWRNLATLPWNASGCFTASRTCWVSGEGESGAWSDGLCTRWSKELSLVFGISWCQRIGLQFLHKKIQVFTPTKVNSAPGDYFEVTAWSPECLCDNFRSQLQLDMNMLHVTVTVINHQKTNKCSVFIWPQHDWISSF